METPQPTSRAEYNAQGKSNNFVASQGDGHLTAGSAAAVLSQRFGRKITARQIEPLANEFHHAGRFGGNKARRVFFFSPEELDRITLADVEAAAEPMWGWVLGFRRERGAHGRKTYAPIVAKVGLIPADQAHRLGEKFHPLAEAEAVEAKGAVGKTLPAYSNDWRAAR